MGFISRSLTWFSSLRTRLLALVLLAVLPAFVVAFQAGRYRQQQDVDEARLDGLHVATRFSTVQTQSIQFGHQFLANLASVDAMRDIGPISCNTFVAESLAQYPFFVTLGMMDAQGNVICQSPLQTTPLNLGNDPYYRHALDASEISIGEYGIGSALGIPVIQLAVLTFDGDGHRNGIAFATLKNDWFDSFAVDANLPDNSTFVIADTRNALVLRYSMFTKHAPELFSSASATLINQTLRRNQHLQLIDADQMERLYVFAPMFAASGIQVGAVGIGLPTQVVLQRANNEFRQSMFVLFGVAGIVLVIAWVFGDLFFLRGIQAVTQATEQLSVGDLSVRMHERYAGGELEELRHRFNLMAETLQQREIERQENEADLRRWADIFQYTRLGISMVSSQRRFEWVNPAYAEMHGYTVEEIKNLPISEIYAPEVRGDLERIIRIVDEQSHYVYESKHIRKDGTVFPVLVDAMVLKDVHGNTLFRMSNVQDLSAIKNAEQSEREQRAFAESLRDTAALLTSTLDFDTVLDRILDNVERVVPHTTAHIMLLEGQVARVVRCRGYRERNLEEWLLAQRFTSQDFPIIHQIMTSAKTYWVSDTRTCSDWVHLPNLDWVRSAIDMPLCIKARPIGVLVLYSNTPGFFTAEHVAQLHAFADQAAIALENARLLQQASARADQMALLYDAGLALNSVLDSKTQNEFLLRISMRALDAGRGEFFRFAPATNRVQLEMCINAQDVKDEFPSSELDFMLGQEQGIVGLVAAQRVPINIGDLSLDPRWLPYDQTLRSGLWVPVQHEQELLGVICLFSSHLNAFSSKDERLLILFANQVAVAMENARLFQAQRKRTLEIETLRQASLRATSTLELPQVLEQILLYAMRLLSGEDAHIFLYDGDQLTFAAAKWADGIQRAPHIPRPNGITWAVARTGERIVVPDIEADPKFHDQNWTGAIVSIPLRIGSHVRGVMNLAFQQTHIFDDNELQILDLLADQATVAIENARLFNETRRRADRLALLNRIARAVNQTLELSQLLEIIYQEITSALHVEAFYIAFYDETTDEIEYRIRYDQGKREPFVRQHLTSGWGKVVASTKKTLLIRDSEKETQYPPSLDALWGSMQMARSWLGVPIMSGTSLLGIISIQAYTPNVYSEEDEHLLMTIADQVASALQNARLFAETRRRLAETESINRLSDAMRTATNPTRMISALLDESLGLMNSQVGEVVVFNAVNDLDEHVARGWFAMLPKGPLQPSGGISWRVFTTGQTYICRDYTSDPITRSAAKQIIPPNWSGVAIPISAGAKVFGVLHIAVEAPRLITTEEVGLLKTLTEIAGNAIQRVRLSAQTDVHMQRLNSLRVVDAAVSGSLDLHVTLNVILDQVTTQLHVNAADILILNPYEQSLTCTASRGLRSAALLRSRLRMNEGYPSRAILESQSVSQMDIRAGDSDVRATELAGDGFIAYAAVALVAKAQVCGVLEIFNRSPLRLSADMREFFQTLGGQAAIAIENISTFEQLQKSSTELMLAYDSTIEAWARILDARHREHPDHTHRVAEMTVQFARLLRVLDADLLNIRRGALLHDTGKIQIPEQILFKPEPLTEQERAILIRHTVYAREYLSTIPYLNATLDIPCYQDEYWDGTGTPKGLAGEQIPLVARIFAIAHAWVEMRYGNLYTPVCPAKQVRDYIQSQSGKRFDPNLVSTFFQLIDK
jgi:PAS domain S-box-containing protein